MVSIANAVGSGDLGVELDVAELGKDLEVPYTEYDPSNYHGLYVRLIEEGPLITVYRSGKYIVSGCTSLEELSDTNEAFLSELASLGITDTTVETGFAIQNLVCTAKLSEGVDLNMLSIALGLEALEYEPEQFPGLIYRPPDHSAVILTFANGKVVVTGASDLDAAEAAFGHLQEEVATVSST